MSAQVIDEAARARHAEVEAVESAEDAERARREAQPRPDPIVKERDIRRTVGILVEGLARQAQSVGMLPRAELAREWATPIVAEQVKKHEESFGKPSTTAPATPAPSALDRGDVEGEVIHRRVGTAVLGAPGAGAIMVGAAPRAAKPVDPLLKARTDMLMALPEWHDKILRAFEEGMIRHRGDASRACDEVMPIIESSNNVFGDWRTPRQQPRPIIVGG